MIEILTIYLPQTLPETNSSPLKNGVGESFGVLGLVSENLLVLGRIDVAFKA